MKKSFELEKILKKVLYIFIVLQPFLDTYYLYTDKIINIFKFSPSTIIRFSIIGLLVLYELIKYRKSKKILPFIFTMIISVIYIVLHHLFMLNFNSVDLNGFNYSFIQEVFYITRLIMVILLIFIINDFKFNFDDLCNIIQISSFIIGFTIVFSNIFKIGLGSYTNEVIADNIFSWFNGAYNTYSYYSLASKGWFNFANQIASLMVIFMPFNIYMLFKKTSLFSVCVNILLMLSGLMLGTKVALFGVLATFIVMLFIYLFDIIVNKKHISINKKALSICLVLVILYIAVYPYTPAKNRQVFTQSIIDDELKQKENDEKDEDMDITPSELDELLNETINSDDTNKKIDFIAKYYKYFRISEGFIEDSYPYRLDPEFWLEIMKLPISDIMDYRILEQKIIQRVVSFNNTAITSLFGISYIRVQNIFNIERDFVLQYYTLGITGLLLFFVIPFIIFPIIFAIYILIKKQINMENLMLILPLLIFVGVGYFSGNIIDSLTVTIYISLILGIMLSRCTYKEIPSESNSKKKISIIALHLGVGGVENSISSLANMLSEKYEVEIISTYKLLDKPAFELNPNIKITYLIENLKPNKEEFKTALANKNLPKIIKEAIKSVKILFLRKYKLIKFIKNIDTDIIITTRHFHNKLIGKYANKNIIKIAEEHNHHNNNKKYINKVLSSLENINYFMPVSQELTDFYREKLKNKNIQVLYIPHALDSFPENTSTLESKNIISVGRLSKEKGFLDLIDVFKEIHSKDKDAKLRIVGDGPEKDAIYSRIVENNLENDVVLCGTKTKEEISNLMLDTSLYLMTSFTESFGLVLIEAESFGIPLLAFDSAQGAHEIIKENENGFLIKNRNNSEMSGKACLLLNDFDKRISLGQNGRNFSKIYTKDVVSKQWIDFIENL